MWLNGNFHLGYVVMGRTLFYRTLNELEHHFSNIKRTLTCSSIGDRTLFLASNSRTSNFEPNRAFTRFTKLLIELT